MSRLALSDYDAGILTADKALADYYETALNFAAKKLAKETAAKPAR